MASKYDSEDAVNFQYYVDIVKQKKMHWDVFLKLMEDLSHSDIERLNQLNAILLTELAISSSDMDQLKYLNVILMTNFKDSIAGIEMSDNDEQQLEVFENSTVDQDLNNDDMYN